MCCRKNTRAGMEPSGTLVLAATTRTRLLQRNDKTVPKIQPEILDDLGL